MRRRFFAFIVFLSLAFVPASSLQAAVSSGYVIDFQKISDTDGGLAAVLENGDFFGNHVGAIGDIDGDGIDDVAVGAPSDDDGGTDRGAVYILFLNADGTVKSEQKISDSVGGLSAALADSDYFGSGMTGIGDLDNDGVGDIAVGARLANGGGTDKGAVFILFLNADGTVKSEQVITNGSGGLSATLPDSSYFGGGVANIGDLDNDGITDLAVGAYGDNGAGAFRGAVYILFMNADGTVKSEQKIDEDEGGLSEGLADYDFFGIHIGALDDIDGDSIPDIAVGITGDDDGGGGRGAVLVLFLNADGTVKGEQKISDTQGSFNATLEDFDGIGSGVWGMGDLDGDGVNDVIIGASGDDDGGNGYGAAYILFLNDDGTVKTFRKISDYEGGFQGTLGDLDLFGISVANIGDIDSSGVTDVLVSAYLDDDGGTNRGAAYVLFLGPASIGADAAATLTEGGATDTVDIVLESEPIGQVDLTFAVSGSEATLDVGGICFSATSTDTGAGDYAPCGLWSDPVTVTLTAVDDADVEGEHAATLTITASSTADGAYDSLTTTTTLTITDNDTAPADDGDDDTSRSGSHRRPSSSSSSMRYEEPQEDTNTVEALRERLAALVAELAALRSSSDSRACTLFTVDMRPGAVGDEVRAAQTFLATQGLFDHVVTGYYGPITESAVRAFQTAHAEAILVPAGLMTPTGAWLSWTRAQANRLAGCE